MADLIRPQARALLRRWSGVLIALAVCGMGLWWGLSAFGWLRWLGWGGLGLGLALGWTAWQRARFAAQGDGPGVVQLIEGEIRYFGPAGGGFVAIEAIQTLALSADGEAWLIAATDGQHLAIPRAASGAETLFDAFAALPGLGMEKLLRISAQPPAKNARMIWRRPARSLLT